MTEPTIPVTSVIPSWDDAAGSARVVSAFRDTFGEAPSGTWAAPGRVNLIGEHTDYNAGLCLPIAIEQRTFVAMSPRTDSLVRISSAQEGGKVHDIDLDAVAPGTETGWTSYIAGIAWALRQHGHTVGGFDAVIDSCVPYGSGLSSSAALQCSVAVAIDDLYGIGLSASDEGRLELARAVALSENEIVGAPTGGMDQTASLRCQRGHALLIDFGGQTPVTTQVPYDLAAHGLSLLIVDTRAAHSLADGQYASRRAACESAAETLGVPTLRTLADRVAAGELSLDDQLARLPDDETRRRVRHVVTEIARVGEYVGMLNQGRVVEAAPLFTASHDSLRYDYEVTCQELDIVVDSSIAAGALGARMTGGGFGGSAISLVRTDDIAAVSTAIVDAFRAAGLREPGIAIAQAASPASRIT